MKMMMMMMKMKMMMMMKNNNKKMMMKKMMMMMMMIMHLIPSSTRTCRVKLASSWSDPSLLRWDNPSVDEFLMPGVDSSRARAAQFLKDLPIQSRRDPKWVQEVWKKSDGRPLWVLTIHTSYTVYIDSIRWFHEGWQWLSFQVFSNALGISCDLFPIWIDWDHGRREFVWEDWRPFRGASGQMIGTGIGLPKYVKMLSLMRCFEIRVW